MLRFLFRNKRFARELRKYGVVQICMMKTEGLRVNRIHGVLQNRERIRDIENPDEGMDLGMQRTEI